MVERVDYYSDEEYAQAMNDEQEEQQAYLEVQWEHEQEATDHDDLRKRIATVLQDMQSIIDYLASPCPTTDMPNKRSRLGVESGELPGYPGAWDGGKLWTQTDERIAVATSASDDLLNDIDSIRKEIDP